MIISEIWWINYYNITIPGFVDFLFSHPYGIIIVEEKRELLLANLCCNIHLIVILLGKT